MDRFILENSSICDSALKKYNFADGIKTVIKDDKTIEDIIANGGITEDELLRPAAHFHDPLRNWDNSGLSGLFGRSTSAPLWAQRSGGLLFGTLQNDYSWPSAREYFYQALIGNNRDENFADCFRSLGQVMHLIEDMSVPA
jgi:hypothetical protein